MVSKKNPNLCTTEGSLIKGNNSLFRISGLFSGKARVCKLYCFGQGLYQAYTMSGKNRKRMFSLRDVKAGKINIMCIERGE